MLEKNKFNFLISHSDIHFNRVLYIVLYCVLLTCTTKPKIKKHPDHETIHKLGTKE